MSVIPNLIREHDVFARLISRLEKSLAREEAQARPEIRNTLLVLLSALDKHEQVEEAVFGHPTYATGEDAKLILGEIEYQHRKIQELRFEFMDALASSGEFPFERLKAMVLELTERLRSHFKTEETRLWPHYENFSRSLDASIRRRLDASVKALERSIEANREAISQYLESGR